jgi:hypothetical protein
MMTMSKTLITSRDPKGTHIVGLLEAALNKARLNEEEAQRVIESGGELQAGLKELLTRLSVDNRFASEEVESPYGYPNKWRLKPLEKQARILAKRFRGLDVSHVEELAARYYVEGALILPKGMDGLVVIPKPSAIARLVTERSSRLNDVMHDCPEENLALWELLRVMSMVRSSFCDYTERKVGPKRYKLTANTKAAYAAFDNLPGDVMVLAVQTGFLHRGKSVRRARFVFGEREFGLCAFAVGIILLTHPKRLTHFDHLWIDCAGSEFATESDDGFSYFLCWRFGVDGLMFDWSLVVYPRTSGSASGAFPECSA